MLCAQGACPLDAENMVTLFTLDKIKADEPFEFNNPLTDIVADYQGGEFSLYFANCESQSAVSFDLQVSPGLGSFPRHSMLPC